MGSLSKLPRTFSKLEQKYKREATPSEVAEELGLSLEEVNDTMKMSGRQVSVDAPFVQGEENSLLDVLEDDNEEKPDEGLIDESLRINIKESLKLLTKKEAGVIILHFGLDRRDPMTLDEIGKHFNLTRERVRQIKEKAIKKLRKQSYNKTLKPYLG